MGGNDGTDDDGRDRDWRLVARPRKARWFAIVGAVALVAVMSTVAALLRTVQTGVHFRLADQVAMVLLGALMAGGLLLFARPRVRAGAAGVEVRNVVNTRTYPWEQVAGFGFPDSATWGRLDLADDEYVPLLAVQVVDGDSAVAAMRGLRELHAEYAPEPSA
ncbi:MAG: PH domain-containing protein [Actinomycetota bacterium]|nr:PH domain-containing protein [Actinomycetota bacterium]